MSAARSLGASCRLVCLKAAEKVWVPLILCSITHGTRLHAIFTSLDAFLLSPPLLALAPPVDLAHLTTHRRLRSRRLQGALRTGTAPLRVRWRAGDPQTPLPSLPALHQPACDNMLIRWIDKSVKFGQFQVISSEQAHVWILYNVRKRGKARGAGNICAHQSGCFIRSTSGRRGQCRGLTMSICPRLSSC